MKMRAKMRHTRFTLLVVIGVVALTLAGCGSGGKTISKKVVEDHTMMMFATTNVEAVNGEGAKLVTCPSGVKIEKGKTFDCTVTLNDGRKAKVTYRITDNKGNLTYSSTTVLTP